METESNGGCPISLAQRLIGGKWKISILWLLGQRTLRFGELRKSLPGITQKMLTQQLRELEEHSLVDRKVYPVVPPKVEYSLTDLGRELCPVLKQMCLWGQRYLKYRESERGRVKAGRIPGRRTIKDKEDSHGPNQRTDIRRDL